MIELQDDQKTEKNKLDQPRPWLVLYELWLAEDGSERLCSLFHDEAVTWDGRLYRPYPVRGGKRSQSADGELSQLGIAFSVLDPVLQPLLNTHRGFIRKRVRMIVVHKDFIDDPSAAVSIESGFVLQAMQDDSESVVRLTIGQLALAEEKVAHRTFGGRCDYIFRDPETCAYAGALTSCDHSLAGPNGCSVHGADSSLHPRRFGGQVGIPKRQ